MSKYKASQPAKEVREGIPELGGEQQKKGVVFLESLQRWMEWCKPRDSVEPQNVGYDASMLTFKKFYEVLMKLRGNQGVGVDGFSLGLLQNCSIPVIEMWWEAVRDMCFKDGGKQWR